MAIGWADGHRAVDHPYGDAPGSVLKPIGCPAELLGFKLFVTVVVRAAAAAFA